MLAVAAAMAGMATSVAQAQVSSDSARRAAADSARATVPDSARRLGPRSTAAPLVLQRDTLRPPLSPGRAFLNSFFLPGLGQSRLQRHSAGALYFTLEAVAVAMLAKSKYDLRVAREHQREVIIRAYQTDPATGAPVLDSGGNFIPADTLEVRYNDERVRARRTHVEDWIAVLIFNHLFSGADAFVSSLLWDLPARVGFRPAPRGVGAGLFIRW